MSTDVASPGKMRNDFNITTLSQSRLNSASTRTTLSPQTSIQQTAVPATTLTAESSESESEGEGDTGVSPSRQAAIDRAKAARALLESNASPAKPAPTFVGSSANADSVSVPVPVNQAESTLVQSSTTLTQNSSAAQTVSITRQTTTKVIQSIESDSDSDGEPLFPIQRRQDSADRAAAARALLAAKEPEKPKKEPTFVRVPATVPDFKGEKEDAPTEVTPPPPAAEPSAGPTAVTSSSTSFEQPPPPPVDLSGALVLPTEGATQYRTEEQQRFTSHIANVTTSQEVNREESSETVVQTVVVEVPPEESGPVDNSDLMAIMEMARNAALLAAKKEEEDAAAAAAAAAAAEAKSVTVKQQLPPQKYTPPPRALSSLSLLPPPSASAAAAPTSAAPDAASGAAHTHHTHTVATTKTVIASHHDHKQIGDGNGTSATQNTTTVTVSKTLDFSSDSDDARGLGATVEANKSDDSSVFEKVAPKAPPPAVRVSNFSSAGMVRTNSVSNTFNTSTTVKEMSFISLSSDSEDSGAPVISDFMKRIAEKKNTLQELEKYNQEAEKPEPTFVHIEADDIPVAIATPVNLPAASPKHDMQYDTIYAEEIREEEPMSASKKYSVTRMESVAVVEAEPEVEAEPVYTSGPESEPRSKYYRSQSPEYATQMRLLEEAAAQRALMRANSFTQSERSESLYTSSTSHFGPLDQFRRREGAYSESSSQAAKAKSYNDANVPLKPEQDLQQLLDMGLSRQEAQEILNEHLSVLMVPPEMRPYMDQQEEESYIISKTVTRRLVRESRHRHHDRRQHREHHTSSRSLHSNYHHRGGASGYAGSEAGSYNRSRNEIYYEDDVEDNFDETDSYYSEDVGGNRPYSGRSQYDSRPGSMYIDNDPYYRGNSSRVTPYQYQPPPQQQQLQELAPSESFYSQDSSYDPRYHQYQVQQAPHHHQTAYHHQQQHHQQQQYYDHNDSFYSQSQDSYADYPVRRPNSQYPPANPPAARQDSAVYPEHIHYNPNNESFYSRDEPPAVPPPPVQYVPQHYRHLAQNGNTYDDRYYEEERGLGGGGNSDSFYSQQSYEPPAVQISETRSTVSSLGRSSYGAMEDSFARKNRTTKKASKKNLRDQFQPMEPIYEQQYQQSLPPTPSTRYTAAADDGYSDAGYFPPRAPPSVRSGYDDYYTEDGASEVMTNGDSEYLRQYDAMYRGGGLGHDLQRAQSMRRTESFVDERAELEELLEAQEEQFGVNMFDALKPQDERKIQDLMQMGFSRNIGVQMVFEERFGVVNDNYRR